MSKNILAVFAHPDDCELKSFGTLRKYQEFGYSVHLLIICDGAGGISVKDQNKYKLNKVTENRIVETKSALSGASFNIDILNYADGSITLNRNLIIDIEKKIHKLLPEIVITHFYDPLGVDHQDHGVVAKAVINVVSRLDYVQKVLLSEPLMTLRSAFVPNVFVDITAFFDEKIKALSMHKSQEGRYYLEREYHENKTSFYAGSVSYNDMKKDRKYEAFQLLFARL